MYAGGEEWRALLTTWLPQSQVEPADLYSERLARALYSEPQYPVVVNLTLGALFAEPPMVDGLDPALWERLSKNADGALTSFADFMRAALRDAINSRDAFVWVDVRPQDAEESRATESQRLSETLALRSIDPRCVQNWTEQGGRLTGILIAEQVEEVADVVEPAVCVWRWTAVDAERVRRWEWRAKPTQAQPVDEDLLTELPEILHGYGRMPVVRLRLAQDHWLGARLHDPAIALMRAENERDWALYRANNELLCIASKIPVDTPKTGAGYWMQLARDADGADTAEYVGPSGTALAECAKRVEDARTSLFRVAQHLQLAADPSAASARQSADSKAKDWEVTAILLESYGDAILDFIAEVCQLVAEISGSDPDAIGVTGIRGEGRAPAEFIADSNAAVTLKQSSPTAAAAIDKRMARLLLADDAESDVMADITNEIDAYYAGMTNGTGAGVLPLGGTDGTTPGSPGGGGEGGPGASRPARRGKGGRGAPA